MFLTIESSTYMAGSFLCGGTWCSVSHSLVGSRGALLVGGGSLEVGFLASGGTGAATRLSRKGATYFLDMLLQGLCNWEGIVGQVSGYLGQVGDFEARVHCQAIQGALVILNHLGRLVLLVVRHDGPALKLVDEGGLWFAKVQEHARQEGRRPGRQGF